MLANSIDEVIARLDAIVDDTTERQSRLGVFAAMYCQVTVAVRDAIDAGRFADGPRMARFDTVFANRYLTAYDDHRAGRATTKSWQIAFEAGDIPQIAILQHLLLGMNAHINLDLGIAAAEICPGEEIFALEGDFRQINDLLVGLLDGVQDTIDRCSPLLDAVDRYGGSADEYLATFSLIQAREQAWQAATMLARLPPSLRPALIDMLDLKTSFLGRLIRQPGPLVEPVLRLVSSREIQDVPLVIGALRRARAQTPSARIPPSALLPEQGPLPQSQPG